MFTDRFLAALVVLATASQAAEFSQIAGDLGEVTEIDISPLCKGFSQVPNTYWTITPATDVAVFTYPANLVEVSSSGGKLSFSFNMSVAETAIDGGGVRIAVPAGQLNNVHVGGGTSAQVLDGFEAVSGLHASGASTLTATITTNGVPTSVQADGASTVTLVSNANVSGGTINGASTVVAKTPSYESFTINGASSLSIDGGIGGSGTLNGASTVTATGDVAAGSLTLNGASTANLATCNSVTSNGGSSCNSGSQSVSVEISELPETATGTGTCVRDILGSIFGGSAGTTIGVNKVQMFAPMFCALLLSLWN